MAALVNLGSLCIDSVYTVPNLAQAGETVASLDTTIHPGGKGLNQSIAAALAGANVRHFGAVGDDGGVLLEALEAAGVDISGIERQHGQSGNAVIQVDAEGKNAIVIAGGANRNLSEELIGNAIDALASDDWLLLQNEINDLGIVLRRAHDRQRKIALNLAPADERIDRYPLELVDILIVNEIEAMAAAESDSVETAFAKLSKRFPETTIVLTEGVKGLRFRDAESGTGGRIATFQVSAVDETAAGDAFVGYFMAGIVAKRELATVLIEASAAGALAVTAMGAATAIPERERVESLVANAAASLARSQDPLGEL